jgi:hypothetical protein
LIFIDFELFFNFTPTEPAIKHDPVFNFSMIFIDFHFILVHTDRASKQASSRFLVPGSWFQLIIDFWIFNVFSSSHRQSQQASKFQVPSFDFSTFFIDFQLLFNFTPTEPSPP